jgi:hypothetical protein
VAFGRPTLSAGLTRAHPRVEEVLRLQGDVVAWGRLHRHDQTPVLSVTGLQDPVGAADLVLWVAEASLNMLHASLLRPHPSLTLCRSQLAMAEATVGGLARCAPGTLTMRLHDILDQSQGSLAAWAASFRPDWGDRLASAVTIRRVHSLSA